MNEKERIKKLEKALQWCGGSFKNRRQAMESTIREFLQPVINLLEFFGKFPLAKLIDNLIALAEKENKKYPSDFYKEANEHEKTG